MVGAKISWSLSLLRAAMLSIFAHLFPRNRKKVLFGAWNGRSFSDNPKYFMLYLLEHTDLTCVWVGQQELQTQIEALNYPKSKLTFVRKGSLAALWHFWTAGAFVCNINWRGDICDLPTSTAVRIFNLWHGIPLKRISDRPSANEASAEKISRFHLLVRELLQRWIRWMYPQTAWTSSSSAEMTTELLGVYGGHRFARERTLSAGLSRNDFLINHATDAQMYRQLKAKYVALLNLPIDKRWYLYLPTFRDWTDEVFSFSQLKTSDKLNHLLAEQNAIIIEKQHPRILQRLHLTAEQDAHIRLVSEAEGSQIDLQELLLVSDRLIGDYSSCFFDFSLLQRPVIHFAYDYDLYVAQRGVVYDLKEICAGPVVATQDELLHALAESDAALLQQRGPKFNEPIAFEKGHASEALCRVLMTR